MGLNTDTKGEPARLLKNKNFGMKTLLLILLFLQRCGCVWSLPRGQTRFSMVFSTWTQLLVEEGDEVVDYDEDYPVLHRYMPAGSAPSISILSSIPLAQDPRTPPLLLCILSGLHSPLQGVMWWVNGKVVLPDAQVLWVLTEEDGAYSATSLWELSAAEWSSRSTYRCGTIQEGRVYRQRLCSGD